MNFCGYFLSAAAWIGKFAKKLLMWVDFCGYALYNVATKGGEQVPTKIGRPFDGEEKRSITIRLRMEPQEVENLDEYAKKLETTRSGAIRAGLDLLKEKLGQKK